MRCEKHDLALSPEGHCVLCRRDAAFATDAERRPRVRPVFFAVLVAAIVGAGVFAARIRLGTPSTNAHAAAAPAAAHAPGDATAGPLRCTNSAGRTGAFYLPSAYASSPLPVLVGIHGTGGNGASIVALFRNVAERERFIVVAPDSRFAPGGPATWQVPSQPGETSDDRDHIRHCLDEVLAMPGVVVDRSHTIIVGYSSGGSTAPYEASVDDFYAAFAVLHGGTFAGGLGPRRAVRGWFSTGSGDPLRPPSSVRDAADQVRGAGLGEAEYHEFPGGHGVSALELNALVEWWLRG